MTGVSVEVGYYRRWLQNFTVVDNLAVAAGDFDPFSVTAPSDPRLPGGGNYVVSGLYNVSNAKAGQTNSYTTWSNNYGSQTSMYNGVLVNVSARMRNGLTVQGGLNTGSTVTDSCDIRGDLPEIAPTNPFCRDNPGLVTRRHRACGIHRSEDRCAPERNVPQRSGNTAAGPVGRLECGGGEDTRPAALRWRAQRDGQPSRAG